MKKDACSTVFKNPSNLLCRKVFALSFCAKTIEIEFWEDTKTIVTSIPNSWIQSFFEAAVGISGLVF